MTHSFRKKSHLSLLLIACLAVALTGCGSKNPPTPPAAATLTPEESITLTVTVPAAGSVAEHQYTAQTAPDNRTALELLLAAGKEQNFPVICNQNYVESVDGVAQYDQGAESGWIYLVNGKMVNVGADQYVPAKGDAVSWIYITAYDQLNNYESIE